jgi:hypothetical protein
VKEHIAKAVAALGKPLPKGAVVHHVDTVRQHNANTNLAIFPDHAYHAQIHARMRARAACGNPNFRKCCWCQQWDDPKNLTHSFHHACRKKHRRRWRARRHGTPVTYDQLALFPHVNDPPVSKNRRAQYEHEREF